MSHWRRHPRPGPPIVDCDAAVVGAGICGVSAAIHLERRGMDVRVLDRCSLGSGASGRNAGFLMRGAAENYAAAVRRHGRDRARELWRVTEENLAALRALGADQLPSYRAAPSVLLALDDGERGELRGSLALLHEDGFRAGWLDHHDDSAWRSGLARGGLVNPDDAQVDPCELLRLLASRLRRPIMDHAEVTGFALAPAGPGGADRVDVRAPYATVRARWCFVCTNAYAPLLIPGLVDKVLPRRAQMLAIPPIDSARRLRLDYSYYANRGSEYFRQAPDGTVVLGGCRTPYADREIGYDDLATPWVQDALEAFADRLFGTELPRRSDGLPIVSSRWSGVMGFTPSALPLIGSVNTPVQGIGEPPPRGTIWFIGGCTGHGMSMFHRLAELGVAAAVERAENPFPLNGQAASARQGASAE